MSDHVTLAPVEAADVIILVDNSVDLLLPGDQVAQRAPLHFDWSKRDQLIAEHGYSLLLTVQYGNHTETLLYDAGLGRGTPIITAVWKAYIVV